MAGSIRLHALATLLFDRPAFRNVICLGHIVDVNRREDVEVASGNAVDPWTVIAAYGADAFRWWMCSSAPPYNPRRFAPEFVGRYATAVHVDAMEYL